MPGIASINNRIDKASSGDAAGFYGQELFLNDGDQALVAVVASSYLKEHQHCHQTFSFLSRLSFEVNTDSCLY